MIKSMTAFATQAKETEWGLLTVEIRSVNHRYLDLSFRLPDILRVAEMSLREVIQHHCRRGKCDMSVKFVPGNKAPFELSISHAMLLQLKTVSQKIMTEFGHAHVNVVDILNWPGVVTTENTGIDALVKSLLLLTENTLRDLILAREREGAALKQIIENCLEQVISAVKKLKKRLPVVLNDMRAKLRDKFAELKLALDVDRLEQEMLLVVQKADITEELDRLLVHCQETQRILTEENVAGRRLDFLLQEMNREANTTASKSNDAVMSQVVIEIKVLIEQMREQVQNIE